MKARRASGDGEVAGRSDTLDQALLRRIRTRDVEALGLLYDRHAPSIFQIILNIVRDPASAEDVLLDTFWQVWGTPYVDDRWEHRGGKDMLTAFDRWKQQARHLKKEVYAVYLVYRDPRVPWYARLLAVLVVGYAFSPIDLIPDFVPILGYLDDLILLPLGIALVLKLIPPSLMVESRARAEDAMQQGKPVNKWAAAIIVAIWLTLALLGLAMFWRFVRF